jgi:hypothetical protein
MANRSSEDRDRDFSANRSMDEPVPGTTGRPMNRRANIDDIEPGEIDERPTLGAMSGGTRSVKILEKNRKIRRAA